jgi:alpha-beta hydrolase superfamily lysophospholipase
MGPGIISTSGITRFQFSKHYWVLTYDTRGHGKTEVTEGDYRRHMGCDLFELLKSSESNVPLLWVILSEV